MATERAAELIQECLDKVEAGLITERFDLWHDMREYLAAKESPEGAKTGIGSGSSC